MTELPTPIVYVPYQIANHNLGELRSYGALLSLFDHEVYPDNVDQMLPEFLNMARARCQGFNPDTDFLALVGSPLYIAAAASIIGAKHQKYRSLRYDRNEHGYYVVEIDRG